MQSEFVFSNLNVKGMPILHTKKSMEYVRLVAVVGQVLVKPVHVSLLEQLLKNG